MSCYTWSTSLYVLLGYAQGQRVSQNLIFLFIDKRVKAHFLKIIFVFTVVYFFLEHVDKYKTSHFNKLYNFCPQKMLQLSHL